MYSISKESEKDYLLLINAALVVQYSIIATLVLFYL